MSALDPRAFLYVAASGEQVRGSPGCVMVETATTTAKYLLLHEVEPQEVRTKVEDLIEEEDQPYFYILFKEEGNIHIVKVSKQEAMGHMFESDFARQMIK